MSPIAVDQIPESLGIERPPNQCEFHLTRRTSLCTISKLGRSLIGGPMRRLHLVLLFSAAHCGSGGTQNSSFRLEISSGGGTDLGTQRIAMQAGDTRLIELLVVGAVPGSVTFWAQGLPGFGRLEGPLLTLSPARADQGEYAITLFAKSGNQTASTSLDLVVNRYNSPPRKIENLALGDDHINVRFPMSCPNPNLCTANGTAKLWMATCDPEGDGITIDVEVVVRGRPFSGQPTYSVTTKESFSCPAYWNASVSLPGLVRETSYDFGVRVSDEFGATEGWVQQRGWGFDQGPCTSRLCACYPSGSYCFQDYECCSGVCILDPPPVGHCQ